tara:strand:- start:7113 stop:7256 length:144 start_codon:yes stop_codon:yes gene_type:complete
MIGDLKIIFIDLVRLNDAKEEAHNCHDGSTDYFLYFKWAAKVFEQVL